LHGGTDYRRVFRFWTGDDTDATVVIDRQGYLYVGSEYQRFDERSRKVGQIMKLDPRKPDDPMVWSIPATAIGFENAGGTWSTPAIYGKYVYEATADGHLMGIDKRTGKILWQVQLTKPVISSPVPVGDVLVQGDCGGTLRALDISKPRRPPTELWRVQLPGCIESTPAVWQGRIYVGTRAGRIYGIGESLGR
jgi:outer membrane protein assembly factor BamB